jgi:predicted DNA-binding transcriptional regulator AlpA
MDRADDPLLAAPAVAARLGISVKTLYAYASAGKFPRPIRIGSRYVRWPSSIVADFMAANS